MLINANALAIPLASNSVHCVVTSPPYWDLRNYEISGQLGSEKIPDCLGWATKKPCRECFICQMVATFREVWRVLRPDGTCWVNIGDKWAAKRMANIKAKDMCLVPSRLALALQAAGWYLRAEVIWYKPNILPSSVVDRPTPAHEQIYLLSKSNRYFYDLDAIREPSTGNTHPRGNGKNPKAIAGVQSETRQNESFSTSTLAIADMRNKRSVWSIPASGYEGAHYATYPPDLVKPCILAGTSARGVCSSCGAPWKRVVEVIGRRGESWHDHKNDDVLGQRGGTMPEKYERRTLGWKPSCKCSCPEPGPATVFDPFTGSGTTGAVTLSLGRRFVGTDLSMTYLLNDAAPRLAGVPLAMDLVV